MPKSAQATMKRLGEVHTFEAVKIEPIAEDDFLMHDTTHGMKESISKVRDQMALGNLN